jgi:hypothetical protein
LLGIDDLRTRAWQGQEDIELHNLIQLARGGISFSDPWDPRLMTLLREGRGAPTLDGYELYAAPFDNGQGQVERYTERMEVLDNGTIRYFRAAVAGQNANTANFVIVDTLVAQLTANVLLAAGILFERGGYHGSVDVGLAITGARGAISGGLLSQRPFPMLNEPPSVPSDDFRSHVRTTATKLRAEACSVSASLLERLFRVIRPPGLPDPLLRVTADS